MTYTPIPHGTLDWDVPVNAAFVDQDNRITTNSSNITTLQGQVSGNLDNLVFNVKNHGAVGDGVTNDAPAINALIDSLEASGTHGTIYFPRGTYLVQSPLTPFSPLRYTGDQGAAIKSSNNHIFDFQNNYMHPGYNGQVGTIEIDHLTLDATGGHCFVNANINQGSFHDLNLIQRSAGFGIWKSIGTLLVINFKDIISTVYGATRSVPAWSVTGNNNADVANLTWNNCLFQNPDFDATQYQVLLQATQAGTGIWYHEQCSFINCYFEGPYGGAVKSLSGEGTLFQNCRTYDTFSSTVGASMFYVGQAANSTWPSTNTSFIGCGRDLQGPNGGTTWDVQLEASTLQTTIANYSVRDIPGIFDGQVFINLGGSSGNALVNNRHQTLSTITSLNNLSLQPTQINFGSSASASQIAIKTSATTDGVYSSRVTTDTVNRFTIMGDGKLSWGPGNGAADAVLYRNSVGLIKTDTALGVTGTLFADGNVAIPQGGQVNVGGSGSGNVLAVKSATANDGIISTRVTTDVASRFVLQASGVQLWGDGTNPADLQIQRSAAGVLTISNPVTANSANLRVVGNTTIGNASALSDGALGDLQIANTPTAPTANPTAGASIYAVGGDLRIRDAAGNIIGGARIAANQGDSSAANQGYITWTFDSEGVSGSGNILASGTVYLHKVFIPANKQVTGVAVGVQTAGATLTAGQSLAGLYDSSGTRVAVTADQSGSWTSTGYKSINFTAPFTPAATGAGFFYVALLSVGTTPPTFYSTNAPSIIFNGNTTGATLRHATNATSQTTLAASLTLSSNVSVGANTWVALF